MSRKTLNEGDTNVLKLVIAMVGAQLGEFTNNHWTASLNTCEFYGMYVPPQ